MPSKNVIRHATTNDGVRLHIEECGTGQPILFLHEFAGDHRSWEPQVNTFSDRYRCVTFGARGYPPSDVPSDPSAYSQERAVADAVAVLDALEIESAHIVGLSMGGFCALHLGLCHPSRTQSLVVAGCGYGAQLKHRADFQQECRDIAKNFEVQGSPLVARSYSVGPARVQFKKKSPQEWAKFADRLAEHSAKGSALTLLGIQCKRPSLYDLLEELSVMTVPTLLITGDEDERCLDPNQMLKDTIPRSDLAVFPQTGHTCNLEEPTLFNEIVDEFLRDVEDNARENA